MNTIHFSKYPIDRSAFWRQDIFQDIFIVSAFVVWATILGLLPVLVIGSLIATWAGHSDWETRALQVQTARSGPKVPTAERPIHKGTSSTDWAVRQWTGLNHSGGSRRRCDHDLCTNYFTAE
jgi:hypothetical protein